MPTYNFAVVVDDIDMEITHVIRGDDHVNNTPRQVNIFRALGAPLPLFAHVPMIVGQDGQRLSKRHGAVSVLEYRNQGFLPEAMRNYLLRLGWSHGDQEIFSTEEMIEFFDLADVNRAASAFDLDKLKWLNQHYIKEADATRLASLLADALEMRGVDTSAGPPVEQVAEALRERAQTIEELVDKSLYFYKDFESYDEGAAKKHLRPVAQDLLVDVRAQGPAPATGLALACSDSSGRSGRSDLRQGPAPSRPYPAKLHRRTLGSIARDRYLLYAE
ncbi:MAG: hypothetical protein EBZ14_12480 [Gammaproteobacteria bacterium]|nr:hypothetical protein [Gammaproteobacteria bacterium]